MLLQRACIALVVLSACVHRGRDSLHSSADGAAYALRYPQALAAARSALLEDEKRARALNAGLTKPLKVTDPSVLQRVVEEADEAGRSEAFAQAYTSERAVTELWSEERAALGARTSAAAQKVLADGGCADKDLGPAVQAALKDGLDRPLERRLRAANEAQRTLELHKARLAPGSLAAWQERADEIALASHYAYVVLPADQRALERLLAEQRSVEAALTRAVDDERKIQAAPHAGEQKASQERVVEIEKARATVAPELELARKVSTEARSRQQTAQDEYEAALKTIRAGLAAQPAPAAASTKAHSVKD